MPADGGGINDETWLVVSQITRQIQSNLSTWFGQGARLTEPEPTLQRRKWSFFLRYVVGRSQGAPVGLLVKIPRLADMTTLAQAVSASDLVPYTRVEYEALRDVSAAFESQGMHTFRAIRPVAFLPDWNAIVMEELPSQPIKHLFLTSGMLLGFHKDWMCFAETLRRTGHWLRIFHSQVGKIEMERLRDQRVDQVIEQTVQELDEATDHEFDLQAVQASLLQQLAAIGDVVVPVATLHTDMTYANVFTTPDGRVGVLDPGAQARGPVYADLATLLEDPDTRLLQVITGGHAFPRARLERLDNAVLQGYFGSSAYNRDVLNLYRAIALMHKWTMDEEELDRAKGLARFVARPARKWIRDYFEHELDGYLTDWPSRSLPVPDVG